MSEHIIKPVRSKKQEKKIYVKLIQSNKFPLDFQTFEAITIII